LWKSGESRKILVVGEGFAGVELAGEPADRGKKVVLNELMRNLLPTAFDSDIAEYAEKILVEKGIEIIKGNPVREINGKRVVFDNGLVMEFDLVITATGARPNIELAERSEL